MRARALTASLLLLALCPTAALGSQAYHGVRITGDAPTEAPQSAAVPYSGPPLILQSAYVGRDAAEPMVGVTKAGTAFFTAGAFDGPLGALARTKLMRSRDGGRTWQALQPPYFGNPDTTRTDLDPYVYVEPDSGRVFDIALMGTGSYLSYSDDEGQTWRSTTLSSPGVNDHQTLAAGPPPKGAPEIQPTTAFKKIVYYCVNHVSDARCVLSVDGGNVFVSTGGPAFVQGVCNALHGHVEFDSEGRVFVPGRCGGFPALAISENGGRTWQQVRASTKIGSADTHTAVAVDREDNLYFVWFDPTHRRPYLSTSTDHGKTWSAPLMIAPPGVFEVNFPEIVAGEAGRIAITFPGSTMNDRADRTRPWNTYVIVSTDALSPNPLFVAEAANPPADPIHRGTCGPGRCAGMFDFLDIQLSPADGGVWASATDTCTEQNDCIENAGSASDAEGLAVRQAAGPWLVGDAVGVWLPAGASPPPAPVPPRPSPNAPPAASVRLKCKALRRRGARCKVRLAGAPRGTTVAVRLLRRRRVVATGAGRIVRGRAVLRLKSVRRLRRGRYGVLISVGRPGASPTRIQRRVRVR